MARGPRTVLSKAQSRTRVVCSGERAYCEMPLPRPTGTRKKRSSLAAPSSTAFAWISSSRPRLSVETVVLTWKGMPIAWATDMARVTFSKAPGTPRKASWEAASGPSRENEQAMTPASFRARRRSSVTSMPQGAMTERTPREVACETSSRMSGRSIGSPPVQMTMGGRGPSESSTRRHSAVESSRA